MTTTIVPSPSSPEPARRVPRLRCMVPAYGDLLSEGQSYELMHNILAWRGAVMGPSDCGYCMWGLPEPDTIRMIQAIRQDEQTVMPLSVSGVHQAAALADFNTLHLRLAREGWPGGLTIVAAARTKEAKAMAVALGGSPTLGLRKSRGVTEYGFVATVGVPLVSALLKRPDGTPIVEFEEAHDLVLSRLVDGVVPAGRLITAVRSTQPAFLFEQPSTVVEIKDGRTVIHRVGWHTRDMIASYISRPGPGEWGDAT